MKGYYEKVRDVVLKRKENTDYYDMVFKDENDFFYNTDLWEENMKLNDKEKKLLELIYSADYLLLTDDISLIVKKCISPSEQKDFFAKLFVHDFLYKNVNFNQDLFCHIPSHTCEEDMMSVFSKYASDDVRNDLEFADTILSIDGCYLSAFGRSVRSNTPLITTAIINNRDSEKKLLKK